MSKFHYHDIKNIYGNNSKLLFPDSLMYEIKTEDVYEDSSKDQEISNYQKFSSYYAESKYYDD